MSTLELQNYLINKISSSEDQTFLSAIQNLVDKQNIIDTQYSLSEAQKKVLTAGESEIANGKSISHSEAISRGKQWLNGK